MFGRGLYGAGSGPSLSPSISMLHSRIFPAMSSLPPGARVPLPPTGGPQTLQPRTGGPDRATIEQPQAEPPPPTGGPLYAALMSAQGPNRFTG